VRSSKSKKVIKAQPVLPFQDAASLSDPEREKIEEQVALLRLGHYLAEGKRLRPQEPILLLLHAFNRIVEDEPSIGFDEHRAASTLERLGARIDRAAPFECKSKYRVTVPEQLRRRAIEAATIKKSEIGEPQTE